MKLTVEKGDPHDPQATRLLQASHALMESLFPAESNHYLSIDALCVPEISFYVARLGDDIKGCGALANKGSYGEIKSMFVDETTRGAGIAQALMDQLETSAREQALPEMRLETGYLLEAAHRLYRRNGFTDCGPFGDYTADPNSLFMEKALA